MRTLNYWAILAMAFLFISPNLAEAKPGFTDEATRLKADDTVPGPQRPTSISFMHAMNVDGTLAGGVVKATGIESDTLLAGYQAEYKIISKGKETVEQSPSGGNLQGFTREMSFYDASTRTGWWFLPANLISQDLTLLQFVRIVEGDRIWYTLWIKKGTEERWATIGNTLPSSYSRCVAHENEKDEGPSILAYGLLPAGELRNHHRSHYQEIPAEPCEGEVCSIEYAAAVLDGKNPEAPAPTEEPEEASAPASADDIQTLLDEVRRLRGELEEMKKSQ